MRFLQRAPLANHPMRRDKREDGSILLLGIGLWVFVLCVVFVVGSLTIIHAERRDLLAQADAIALAVANEVSDAAYYSDTPAAHGFYYDTAQVRSCAQLFLERDPDADGVKLTTPTGQRGDGVVVSLEKVVRVPFVPSFLDSISDVALTVTSQARLRTIDGVD